MDERDAARALGATLRDWREQRGWSLRHLAQRLGYKTHSELSAYERGERVLPAGRVDEVARLLDGDAAHLRYLQHAAAAERRTRRAAAPRRRPLPNGDRMRPRPARFIGRQEALDELGRRVAEHPVVALTGPSGTGVREIVWEFVTQHAADYAAWGWLGPGEPLDAVSSQRALVVVEAEPMVAVEELGARLSAQGGRVIVSGAQDSPAADATALGISPFAAHECLELFDHAVPELAAADALAVADAVGRGALGVELAAGLLVAADASPSEIVGLDHTDGVGALVRSALAYLASASPTARQLISWLAKSDADVILRADLAARRSDLPVPLAEAVDDEVALLDAVVLLHRLALVRPGADQLWTHALVRAAVRGADRPR